MDMLHEKHLVLVTSRHDQEKEDMSMFGFICCLSSHPFEPSCYLFSCKYCSAKYNKELCVYRNGSGLLSLSYTEDAICRVIASFPLPQTLELS